MCTNYYQSKAIFFEKDKSAVITKQKQFSIKLGHAIAVHKSQGSTLIYKR